MNRLIRYLTFSAPRPTFYYETGVYMTFRVLLACAVFFASAWSAPAPARIWMLVSAIVAVTAASASQTARSGAARKSEERAKLIQLEPVLLCEDALKRAANVGSFCAALAPATALGSSLTSAVLGTTRGLVLVAAVLAAFQGAFDAAWSLWIYPAWRRRYTRERDRLRVIQATIDYGPNGDAYKQAADQITAIMEHGVGGLPNSSRVRHVFEASGHDGVRAAIRGIGDEARARAKRTAEEAGCGEMCDPVMLEDMKRTIEVRRVHDGALSEEPEDAPTIAMSRDAFKAAEVSDRVLSVDHAPEDADPTVMVRRGGWTS